MIPSAVAADDKTSPANADDATSAETTDARFDSALAAFFEDDSLRSSLKAAATWEDASESPSVPVLAGQASAVLAFTTDSLNTLPTALTKSTSVLIDVSCDAESSPFEERPAGWLDRTSMGAADGLLACEALAREAAAAAVAAATAAARRWRLSRAAANATATGPSLPKGG